MAFKAEQNFINGTQLLSDTAAGMQVLIDETNQAVADMGSEKDNFVAAGDDLFMNKVPQVIPDAADLDTYITQGYFSQGSNVFANNGSNYPVAVAGFLKVFSSGATQKWQEYRRYDTGEIYVRHYFGAVWQSWVELSTIEDEGTFIAVLKNEAGDAANGVVNDEGYYCISGGFIEIWCSHQSVGESSLISNGSSPMFIDLSILGVTAKSGVSNHFGGIVSKAGGYVNVNSGGFSCFINAGEDKLRLAFTNNYRGGVAGTERDDVNTNPRHEGIYIKFPIA